MKSPSEHPVDTVLAALREAEPDAGMEQRIRTALYQEQHRRQNEASSTPVAAWKLPGAWFAAAALASLLVAASAVLQQRHRAGEHRAGREVETAGVSSVGSMAAPPSVPVRPRTALPAAARERRLTTVARRERAATEDRHGAAAERNIPEPPEALTRQERLLLQVVHHTGPVQLAELTPAMREQELHREQERFQEFFMPPPPLEAEGQP